ncbi:2',3'-cyclic-nucleotide 3'-phosphodiesterase [Rhincodon typus]|uniref:2',3'-cyclic-nucleotide 3'-phosphodiesterase n=1 Tax=Rhincodon typus TaxID=259920 RepID=UPI0009A39FB3|nr:2',3'-cyclic-nucleotide 3'-phosphodiesterase [Rhincodon typus]XP_048470682.1 2',3'-cyclic-nucleotide 3'-phosphodiesterase [Rhincodon typus]XP_048470684.1 2',3'-cyclic-nucleotide 3'-phosphodiesterase [Rhincodon typus]XP_048470685.1 2',3'-cyclic-nucleotide 3'-phosphodiesterase [Rhincodon typus]
MGAKHSKVIGNFPFLNDNGTIETIKEAHTLFVLRGLPGSGKSILGKAIKEKYPQSLACASKFPPVADEAETDCDRYAQVDEGLEWGFKEIKNVIVVDDNHLAAKRLDHLTSLARDNDYIVLIVSPKTEWRNDCEKLATQSQWKLTVEQLNSMKQSYQEYIIPYFFGWFLLRRSAQEMRKNAEDFLKQLSEMEVFLKEFVGCVEWHSEEKFNLQEYFQKKPRTLHCTTKFCNYGEVPVCRAYAESKVVEDNYSKAFTLQVVALFVTPRTVGARVLLNKNQELLWPKEQEGDDGGDGKEKADLPFGSRAHITLACAPRVKAVQTGLDLLHILKLEEGKQPTHEVDVEKGQLCCYDEGQWILNLTKPIEVKTLFSGFYPKKTEPITESVGC